MARPVECKKCNYTFHHSSKEEKDLWLKDYHRCPMCKTIYCDLPKTEKKLRELQDIYLVNRNEHIFRYMVNILEDYVKSMIKKKYIHKIDKGQLDNYTKKAVGLFADYYLLDPDFKVNYSFAGLLQFKIKQACFNKTEHNLGDISLNYKLPDGNIVEYEDDASQIDYLHKVEKRYDKFLLYKKMLDIIDGYDEYDSNEEQFLSYIGLYFNFCFSEKRSDMLFRILEESDNKKRILKQGRYRKYKKIPDKKKGKVGKYHFLQIKNRLKNELLSNLEN